MKKLALSVLLLCAVAGAALAEDKPAAATAAPAAASAPAAAEPAKPAAPVVAPAATAPAAAAVAPTGAAAAVPPPAVKPEADPIVEIVTSEGKIKLQLDAKLAPETVKNFVGYANEKFYDGTVFHRVINKFMVQGGGYVVEGGKLNEKKTKASIQNEAKNGLKNDRGTVAMARTPDPNSATSQFFINLVNNDRLNFPAPDGHGYAVFGKVIEGMDVVDKIAGQKTGMKQGMGDVPEKDIVIQSITVSKSAS